jgi:hypothetical protein
MDQGASQRGPALRRGSQPSCKLFLEVRDSAKVEHLKGSFTSGRGIRAANAEERHGHVFRY